MKRLLIISVFALGALASKAQKKPVTTNNNTIICSFEQTAAFPGGLEAWYKFISKNLKWPNQDDVQGKVIISFIVEKDGHLSAFKVIRSLGKEFDVEALRVLKLSPKWLPAMQNGKPVKCGYTVPINFAIAE